MPLEKLEEGLRETRTAWVNIARGFEDLFPWAEILDCVVCLSLQLFPLIYPHANLELPSPLTTILLESSPPQLPISNPPNDLHECFFFNSLVVGLPYSSIFWQFWLFFIFKLFVVLLLAVQ